MGESKDLLRKKNSICVSSKMIVFKDNVKSVHWVGHSQLISLDTYGFFKSTHKFDEKQASVTRDTVKQSFSEGGKSSFITKRRIKYG